VQLITAPLAIALDALSYVASVISLSFIHVAEPPTVHATDAPIWAELREGLGVVLGNPLLRSIAGCTATSNLFGNALMALFVLYLTRELGIQPAVLGVILAAGGPGALLGAVLAGRLARWWGLGATIIGAITVSGLANLLVPLAAGPPPLVAGVLMASAFLNGLANPIYNINQVSLRQAITPDRLQGRMNASMRFLVWGTIPVGALLGGVLGETLGLRPTMLLMAVCSLLAPLWVVCSPVRHLRQQPAPVPA
jgi:predicted MFS family arabinose efflux permease